MIRYKHLGGGITEYQLEGQQLVYHLAQEDLYVWKNGLQVLSSIEESIKSELRAARIEHVLALQ